MSTQRYAPEFKEEAVRQIVERGYSVADVSARLGVSSHSLYKWVKAVKPDKPERQAAELLEAKSEILKLRAQLRRTEEERDILKKAAVGSAGRCNSFMKRSSWRRVTQGFSWSRVHALRDRVEPLLRQDRQIRSIREVLP